MNHEPNRRFWGAPHDRLMKSASKRSARREYCLPNHAARYWPGLLLAGLLLGSPLLAAPGPLPPLPRPGVRTNLPPPRLRTNVKTNPPAAALKGAAGTNAATPAPARSPLVSGLRDSFNRLRANPSFYPAAGISLLLIALVVVQLFKSKSKKRGVAAEGQHPRGLGARPASPQPRNHARLALPAGRYRRVHPLSICAHGGLDAAVSLASHDLSIGAIS